jgi:YHS domain-containing protein
MANSSVNGYIATWVYNCKIICMTYNLTIVNCSLYLRKHTQILFMFKDPVCNMMVDEKKTKVVSESGGGRKVYLCSAACKSQFEANPSKHGC